MSVPPITSKGNLMKRIYLMLGICLTAFCLSCSPQGTVTKMMQPVAEEQETVIDRGCAYFYFLWGKAAENDLRYEEALHAYEKVLVCDPDTEYVILEIAILLIKMNRQLEAVDWLDKVIKKNPSDTENRFLLAKLYTSMGDIEKAAEVYNEILAIKEDQQTLLMLGSLYAQNGDYEKAKELLERMVKLNPESYMGHYYLARIYREVRLFSRAIKFYEKALNIAWSNRMALEVSELYEQEELYEKAINLYQRVLEEDDTNEMAKTKLINLFLKTEETELALKELQELQIFASDPEAVNYTISRILLSREQYDDAISLLSSMLKEDKDANQARYLLALAYYQQGEMRRAKELVGLIPPEAEEFEDGILLHVRILKSEEQSKEATEILEELLKSENTRKMRFYIMLTALYKELDQVGMALELFSEAHVIYPENPELYFEHAIFLERIGEQDQAMEKMQELLKIDPDNAAALNYVGYTWADKGVNLEEALQNIRKAVALRPEDGFIRDSLGWVYFRLGNIKQAVSELEKALELVTGDPIIYEHMGDVYLKAGEPQKAIEAYKKALERHDEEKKEGVEQKIKEIQKGD